MTVQTLTRICTKKHDYLYSIACNTFQGYSKPYLSVGYGFAKPSNSLSNKEYLYFTSAKHRVVHNTAVNPKAILVNTAGIACYSTMPEYKTIYKWVCIKPNIDVSYINRNSINTLLGERGKLVLENIINLIKEEAEEYDWHLTKIEINKTEDLELNEWEYISLILYFDSTIEIADKNLYDLYGKIDCLADSFSPREKEILQGKIYFDVRASVPQS